MNIRKFFDVASPEKLNIADKPPLLGGIVRTMPTADFVKQVGMTH